jgi:hypothetical protein
MLLAGCGSTTTVAEATGQHDSGVGSDATGGMPATPGPDSSAAYDVAWVDRPAPTPYVPSAAPVPPPPTDSPPCRADQVSARYADGAGAAGNVVFRLEFSNLGPQACLLRGVPRVVATQPGLPQRVATPGNYELLQGGLPGDMAPGGHTDLALDYGTACDTTPQAGTAYHHLSVTLPGGGTVPVTVPGGRPAFDPTCGFEVGHFYDPIPQPDPPPPPYAGLVASLTLPDWAQAGSELDYVVTLTNPTVQAIGLDPCPGYVEAANSGQTQTIVTHPSLPPAKQDPRQVPIALAKQAYALNCATVTTIPAHQAVRYQMRLQLPPTTPPGSTNIYWSLWSAGKVFTTGAVEVR